MSDIDLTMAVEAAAKAAWESDPARMPWVALDPVTMHNVSENVLPAVAAAAPLIAAQVRAQIAEDIDGRADVAQMLADAGGAPAHFVEGLRVGAVIARRDA